MDGLDFQLFSTLRSLLFFIVVALFTALEYFFYLHKIGKAGVRKRRILNWQLGLINMLLMFPVSTLGTALYCEYYRIGVFYYFGMSWWQVCIAWYLIYDLFFYLYHRFVHSRLLWRIHQTHHTETSMNITTSFRFHPLDFSLFTFLKVGLIFIMGPWFFVLFFVDFIQTTIVLFCHSNVRINTTFERILSGLIVTPRYHLMHHREQCQCNFSTGLTIWDHLGGTYCVPVWEQHAVNLLKLGIPQRGRQDSLQSLLHIGLPKRERIKKNVAPTFAAHRSKK